MQQDEKQNVSRETLEGSVDMLDIARVAQDVEAREFAGMGSLKLVAPAKVNLYLNVKGVRDDGYHEVSTTMHALMLHDVLRNAAPAMVTITALSIGTLLGGSVVIETIFSWPGLGKLAMDAISDRDYPVIQGFVLFTATVYVAANLLSDLCCGWVDPRVREEARP